MCGTNDILQGRDSTYVFKTLVKAIELASTKGKVIIGLETQIDSDMDGLDLVVRDVNEQLKAYAAEHDLKVIDFYTTLYEADQIGQIVLLQDAFFRQFVDFFWIMRHFWRRLQQAFRNRSCEFWVNVDVPIFQGFI